jgi:hypothetical protein
MAELLSVANTAVSPANVVVADSVEICRSAVYSRCNSGPRTLPLGTPDLTEEFCVLRFKFNDKVSAIQIGFE